jgi:predicted PurR-regulated permease PerM
MENRWSIQTRYLVLVILLLLLGLLIHFVRPLFAPLIVAALLAYVLDPAVSFLTRKTGMPRRAAVPIVYVLLLLFLASLPAIATPVIIAQIDDIQAELVSLQDTLGDTLTRVNTWGIPLLPSAQEGEILDLFSLLFDPQRIFGVLLSATENVVWILITMVATFYLLMDGERLRDWSFTLAPDPYKEDLVRLHGSIKTIWSAYLRGQLLLMLIIGVLTWLMAMAVGLRGSLLIGILAGALDVIPSLGPVVAMVIAGVVAYLEGSTILPLSRFWFTLLVVGLFTGIQAFENVYLRPRILSQSLRLHPALVFVAIVGALYLAGVVMALIIVPLISSIEIVCRYLFRRILGLDPWEDEPQPADYRSPVMEDSESAAAAAEAEAEAGSEPEHTAGEAPQTRLPGPGRSVELPSAGTESPDSL